MRRFVVLALIAGSLAMVAPASSSGMLRVSVTNDVRWHGPATIIVSQSGMAITMVVAPSTTRSISVHQLATSVRLKTSICDTRLALPFDAGHRTSVGVVVHANCVLSVR